ncbi:unnamed protein product [Rotaria socialis]|uniref:Uncharacterized protein n=1 Tax=Rotaria socialis TaxID=392032 RepID=A0A820TGM3_9BILA|nr:unnamed protein product [Rotaria socialis]CAF3284450.1 unnamed protein product [Rotaria socialis]CAF3432786.1 unnamed protein product [Rotaria socialis]CAF3519645.1 unnamed protein product [Rotaria socialis]CAF4362760.1 unnamed protein product [Rotaria socialis]
MPKKVSFNTKSVKKVQATVDPKGSNGKISRRRRGSRGSQPQQQLPENEILFKVQEMQERLNFEIRQQVALSERMDTIVRLYVNEERALQKVRRQVDGLIDMSKKVDISLDFVVQGITKAQRHIQNQCHQDHNVDDDDDDNDDINNHHHSSE